MTLHLRRDRVEASQQLVELLGGEDTGAEQRPSVSARSAHVVGSQAPVEGQRRVQLPEDGIWLLLEAGHGGAVYERRRAAG